MSGKQSWISISSTTIFMQVSGAWQRVRPGQEITGTIAKDLEVNFKRVKAAPAPVADDAAEIAELKKWLDENEESYQPNTGVVKLRKYKAAKEAELAEAAAEEGTGDEPNGGATDEEADKEE